MKFEKKYIFKTWNDWNHIIAFSVEDFSSHFHLYPNYLLANDYTLSQIDFIASIRPNINPKMIGTFTSKEKGYEALFCIENMLLDKEFILVYDDESDEDTPIEDIPSPYLVGVEEEV